MASQLPAPASTPIPLRRFGRLQPPTRRIRLDSDLLSLSTHPSEPLLAVGESSGRVSIWGWPIDSGGSGHHSNNIGDIWGRPTLEDEHWWQKKWSTKRHKGSTRCVRFSSDGEGTQTPLQVYLLEQVFNYQSDIIIDRCFFSGWQ